VVFHDRQQGAGTSGKDEVLIRISVAECSRLRITQRRRSIFMPSAAASSLPRSIAAAVKT
jgi:hypothetical protein